MATINTVSTLGTLHDHFLSNPQYSLKHFIFALDQYKPDIILTEILPDHFSIGEAAIDGGIEQSVILAFAKVNNISIHAVDWFDDNLILAQEEEFKKETQELKNTVAPMYESYKNAFSNKGLLELNGPTWQAHIQKIYELLEKNGLSTSRERNERICKNIIDKLKGIQGKRVLILFGLDHKFFIDNCVSQLEGTELIHPSNWHNESNVAGYIIPKNLRTNSLENLKTAELLLKNRLENKYYSDFISSRLEKKLPRFKLWIDAVSTIK